MAQMPLRVMPSASNFRNRRRNNWLYVDKTAQIVAFLAADTSLLFTRPRRFGKSLLLSTIEAMYSGDRNLFQGNEVRPELAVYRDATWTWQEHTVLRLDMMGVTLEDGEDSLVPALDDLVYAAATELGMEGLYRHSPRRPASSLINLVQALSARSAATTNEAGIVILVDEYDAPILNLMHTPQGVQTRQQLANFYGVFKTLEGAGKVEKLVMTGVTRFVKTGLWSKLNQVQDQTDNPDFHDLIGFTDTELDVLWHQVGSMVPAKVPRAGWPALSREAWQEWYNGYRFTPDATETLYNPYAIMCSLARGHIREYWSQTGHLDVVEKLLQAPWTQVEAPNRVPLYLTRPVPVPNYELRLDWLDSLTPDRSPEAVLVQWEPAQLVPLLYQTGYLTLAPSGELAPPNREIAAYLSHVLLDPWLDPGEMTRATWFQAQMLDALQHLDIPGMVAHFNALLHLLPHQRFQGSGSSPYNLVLDLVVLLAHGHIGYLIPDRNPSHDMEMSGLQGNLDTALGWDDISLVLEFKTGSQASAHSGQTQIREHAYLRALPRKSRLYLGLLLYLTGRQIAAWECQGYSDLGEPLGQPLTHRDPWPAHKEGVYQRWAVDLRE